jgi:hypothetical protein
MSLWYNICKEQVEISDWLDQDSPLLAGNVAWYGDCLYWVSFPC